MIIDIEHEYPFALTVDSVDNLAGKNNPLLHLKRAHNIHMHFSTASICPVLGRTILGIDRPFIAVTSCSQLPMASCLKFAPSLNERI